MQSFRFSHDPAVSINLTGGASAVGAAARVAPSDGCSSAKDMGRFESPGWRLEAHEVASQPKDRTRIPKFLRETSCSQRSSPSSRYNREMWKGMQVPRHQEQGAEPTDAWPRTSHRSDIGDPHHTEVAQDLRGGA